MAAKNRERQLNIRLSRHCSVVFPVKCFRFTLPALSYFRWSVSRYVLYRRSQIFGARKLGVLRCRGFLRGILNLINSTKVSSNMWKFQQYLSVNYDVTTLRCFVTLCYCTKIDGCFSFSFFTRRTTLFTRQSFPMRCLKFSLKSIVLRFSDLKC